MHERTQQAIGRLLFVLCCAGPSILTITWILITCTTWFQNQTTQDLQERMESALGLSVTFESYQHPAPNHWVFANLNLRHPETLKRVGKVREAHWLIQGNDARMLLEQPELEANQIAALWKSIHDRFLCYPDNLKHPLSIAANDLTIKSGNHSFTLSDLDAWVENSQTQSSIVLQLHLADGLNHAPMMMKVKRNRDKTEVAQSISPSTSVSLNTNGTALPCSALADFLPTIESLGSSATFTGNLRWELANNGWSIDLAGSRFTRIELDRLFENHAHRLSGNATIELDRCFIAPNERKSDLTGQIRVEEGLIGKTLLKQFAENLQFKLLETEVWNQFSGDLPYDLIAMGFNINGTQMRLTGICQNERGFENYPSGVAIVLDGYPLAQTFDEAIESVRLLAAIAPLHSVPVPISAQTDWLTNILLPPSRPLPRSQSTPPRIRSARVWEGGPLVQQPR
ncbi:MAG: hypothetical protein VXZ38_05530 [Planctomycetota bacterium]|nr:hypothetical protein [Planctomycetota bacterium]